MSAFVGLGNSDEYFHFYCLWHRSTCKQTVKTLSRRRVLRRLNWVCTVCIRVRSKKGKCSFQYVKKIARSLKQNHVCQKLLPINMSPERVRSKKGKCSFQYVKKIARSLKQNHVCQKLLPIQCPGKDVKSQVDEHYKL